MAKKSTKSKESIYYKNEEGRLIKSFPSFVYEVEVYVIIPKVSYYLHDTTNLSLKEFKKEGITYTKKDGKIIKQCLTLLAAPVTWLDDNKFISTSL